jgi:hypothetical protein
MTYNLISKNLLMFRSGLLTFQRGFEPLNCIKHFSCGNFAVGGPCKAHQSTARLFQLYRRLTTLTARHSLVAIRG